MGDNAQSKILYNPRANPEGCPQWQANIADRMRKAGIPSWILDGPPTLMQIQGANASATSEEAKQLLLSAMAEYQTSCWLV